MRKLIFKLAPQRQFGLRVNLHTGSYLDFQPGQQLPYDIPEKEKRSDAELKDWYDVRYKAMGLSTKVYNPGSVVTPKEDHFQAPPPPPQELPAAEPPAEPVEVTGSKVEPTEGDAEVPGESEAPAEGAAELPGEGDAVPTETKPVKDWSFEDMRTYVKDHNLTLEGRGKDDYIKAIEAHLASQTEQEG